MNLPKITLNFDDPTMFAVCSGECGRRYRGKKAGNYYGKAYTTRQWKRGQECENCHSPMRLLFQVGAD